MYKIFFPGQVQISKIEAFGGRYQDIQRAVSQMAKVDKKIIHYKMKYYFCKIQPFEKKLYIVIGIITIL